MSSKKLTNQLQNLVESPQPQNPKFLKLPKTSQGKSRQKAAYSSFSRSFNVESSMQMQPRKQRASQLSKLSKTKERESVFKWKHQQKLQQLASRKYNRSITLKTSIRTIEQLPLNRTIMSSIKIIRQHQLNSQIDTIKSHVDIVMKDNSRQNRIRLVQVLQQLHPFFSKIHRNIAQAIVLLGKFSFYYKGQLIFEHLNNPFAQTNLQYLSIDKHTRSVRSKQDIGFMLFGKLQICNDTVFYSHFIKNFGTLFQSKFIGRPDKIQYYAKVLATSMIIWLPKDSYYVIRKQCFLSLDLKYMFGQFENMLKFNMVHKNLPIFKSN